MSVCMSVYVCGVCVGDCVHACIYLCVCARVCCSSEYACVCVQAMEVFSRVGRYDGKADMFSVVIIICELITTYMISPPWQYLGEDVRPRVAAAVDFLQPHCPQLAQLLRDGFTDVATERPSSQTMLSVLESPAVVKACAADISVPVIVLL